MHARFECSSAGGRLPLINSADLSDLLEQFWIQPNGAPTLAPQKIEDLVAGEAIRPGQEGSIRVVAVTLLPKPKACLLENVVEIDLMGQQGAYEGVDLPLVPNECRHKGIAAWFSRFG